jgi:hypothetical protein
LHLSQCTRPDIALTVGALAPYHAGPSRAQYRAMLDVMRYVGATAARGITYGTSNDAMSCWCDSNFATCLDTRRSTTGYVATMHGGAITWSSRKQATVATSFMEAEYQACGEAAREGLSLLKGFRELRCLQTFLLLDP